MFEIVDAHKQGVTALAVTSDSRRLVTGGGEGQVRVWQIDQGVTPKVRVMHKYCTSLRETVQYRCTRTVQDPPCLVSYTLVDACIAQKSKARSLVL